MMPIKGRLLLKAKAIVDIVLLAVFVVSDNNTSLILFSGLPDALLILLVALLIAYISLLSLLSI